MTSQRPQVEGEETTTTSSCHINNEMKKRRTNIRGGSRKRTRVTDFRRTTLTTPILMSCDMNCETDTAAATDCSSRLSLIVVERDTLVDCTSTTSKSPSRKGRSLANKHKLPLMRAHMWSKTLFSLVLLIALVAAGQQAFAHTRLKRQDPATTLATESATETTTTTLIELTAPTTLPPPAEPPTATTTTATPTTSGADPASGELTTNTPAATSSTSSSSSSAPAAGAGGGKSKIPPVNYTQVNEFFEASFDEAEVVEKWRHMDKQLTDGVRSILKIIFPHIVAMSSDAKVSGACSGAILKWILNLRNLRSWAVKMLDAIGKPNAGILEGSLTMFGNYHQCLSIRAPDEDEIEIVEEFREYFRGQYCVLQLKPYLTKKSSFLTLNSTFPGLLRSSYKYYEKTVYDDLAELAMAFNYVNIRADLCVPSLCSRDDIQRVASYLGQKADMRARVLRCDVEPMEGQSLVDETHLIWSVIFIILILLVIISTLASIVFKVNKRRSKSKAHSLFTSMSITKSFSHIKNVQIDRISDSKPVFLYTLRLIIVFWILLVGLISQLDFQYLRELLSLRKVIMLLPMQIIVNSSLQFDALILLTAFTYSYQNINSNLKDLIKYNISKYSRLMPSIMLFVALTIITPLLYQNQSPIWHDFVDTPSEVCQSTGLVNLMFLQNFLNYDKICLPQTWIFCVELQLCILAIPVVYMLNKEFDQNHGKFKFNSLPILCLIIATLAGCIINFLSIYQNSLPGAWFHTYPDKLDRNIYFSIHLYKTWTHLTVFAVGLFAGHLCRCQSIETFSGRPYGRKCCNTMMWLTSLTLMGLIIFSTHSWSLDEKSHLEAPMMSALYGSLAPLLWSVAWSLILFHLTVPNDRNQRSTLSLLLASDINLVRLGRLTFLAYLINPYVNSIILAAQEQAIFSSILMLAHTFIGNLVITFIMAIAISALVELPCRRLIKKLALGSRRQCGNLGIITRQLNITQQNLGPSHDSFSASQQQQQQLHQQHHQQQLAKKQQLHSHHLNHQVQQPMIPLRSSS